MRALVRYASENDYKQRTRARITFRGRQSILYAIYIPVFFSVGYYFSSGGWQDIHLRNQFRTADFMRSTAMEEYAPEIFRRKYETAVV